MSGNFAIKGGGVGRLMANAILNFHFDFLHPSLNMSLKKSNICIFFHSIWKNLHLTEIFYTDTVCGVCDKYEVCIKMLFGQYLTKDGEKHKAQTNSPRFLLFAFLHGSITRHI